MDFLTELPRTSAGHTGILVVVDRFSKMAYFLPTKEAASAQVCADLIFQEVVARHGIPRSIVSDRDSRFTSGFWKQLWRNMKTNLQFSTAFHPQTDG